MAKRPKMTEEEFQARWRKLPEADRRFIGTLTLVNETLADGRLRYRSLPPLLERRLRQADRNTLFSIITECVGILTHAPAMQRIQRFHRRRATRANGSAPAARHSGRPPARRGD
jgi:hypothetical protein